MKHLIAKKHHTHYKKRSILELVGLIAIVVLSVSQRDIMSSALNKIKNSDPFFIILLLGIYWLLPILTSMSYKILSPKKLPVFTTILAQIAASGPGRIIPGGLGNISISAVYLHKLGLKTKSAVLIPITNNLIGLMTNVVLLIGVFIYSPSLLETLKDRISIHTSILLIVLILISFSIVLMLYHFKKVKKTVNRTTKQWRQIVLQLMRSPSKLAYIFLIAAVITLTNALLIILASRALSVNLVFMDSLIALSVGVMFGSLLPSPGGLGAVEAGTASGLIMLGYDPATATSIALLYRSATYWQPLIPGILSYLYLRERKLL